jgi:hypothetical protein
MRQSVYHLASARATAMRSRVCPGLLAQLPEVCHSENRHLWAPREWRAGLQQDDGGMLGRRNSACHSERSVIIKRAGETLHSACLMTAAPTLFKRSEESRRLHHSCPLRFPEGDPVGWVPTVKFLSSGSRSGSPPDGGGIVKSVCHVCAVPPGRARQSPGALPGGLRRAVRGQPDALLARRHRQVGLVAEPARGDVVGVAAPAVVAPGSQRQRLPVRDGRPRAIGVADGRRARGDHERR